MKIVKILVLIIVAGTFFACKKTDPASSLLEDYLEDNILNRNFFITYALNKGSTVTDDYNRYIFLLKKGSDYYNGPLIVTKGNDSFTGTWSSTHDFGRLKIVLPGTPEVFKFLTRNWRFTSKKLPVLKFAPWGSSDNDTALTMERE